MEVTVDKVGRVVMPKQLRTAFGIGPDSKLTIHEDGVGIRMEPVAARERRIEERDGFLVLLAPEGDHEPVTDEVINRLRDAMQGEAHCTVRTTRGHARLSELVPSATREPT